LDGGVPDAAASPLLKAEPSGFIPTEVASPCAEDIEAAGLNIVAHDVEAEDDEVENDDEVEEDAIAPRDDG
jgi:hypothetical protein